MSTSMIGGIVIDLACVSQFSDLHDITKNTHLLIRPVYSAWVPIQNQMKTSSDWSASAR